MKYTIPYVYTYTCLEKLKTNKDSIHSIGFAVNGKYKPFDAYVLDFDNRNMTIQLLDSNADFDDVYTSGTPYCVVNTALSQLCLVVRNDNLKDEFPFISLD